MKFKNGKGVSIFIALILMAILLAVALGISSLLVGQLKMMRGIGHSVIAFYAADTGIERALYGAAVEGAGIGDTFSISLANGANATSKIIAPGEDGCPSSATYCINSIGYFKKTRRAIRISR